MAKQRREALAILGVHVELQVLGACLDRDAARLVLEDEDRQGAVVAGEDPHLLDRPVALVRVHRDSLSGHRTVYRRERGRTSPLRPLALILIARTGTQKKPRPGFVGPGRGWMLQ